jgi:leucyl aminopeptidase
VTSGPPSAFEFVPSLGRSRRATAAVAAVPPSDAGALGVPVTAAGAVPPELGLDRGALTRAGFDGAVGQALALPGTETPMLVAFGVGDADELDVARLRDAAAAFATALPKQTNLAVLLPASGSLLADRAAAALVEGMLLARYSYDPLKAQPSGVALHTLTVIAASADTDDAKHGAREGETLANATQLARDLGNAPPGHLTATSFAEIAQALGPERNLQVEVFDERALAELQCGGLLGVNAGSVQPPRMIRLTYTPREQGDGGTPSGRLALVGKGVMYDSGGISLKPSDPVHATMKTDMSGAGAALAAMFALSAVDCPTAVTAYVMCAENMPSGSALRLGDVLTIHGGTTVEVQNTDAEGRLIMADALVMAAEEGPDAIIDVATLTGACLRALGTEIAGVFGNNQDLVEQLLRAARDTSEPLWQLPLDRRYRGQLESEVADLRNIGSGAPAEPGAITAALFLAEFVGSVPWAHLDIAGTAYANVSRSWLTRGATGFGARVLIDAARSFTPPAGSPDAGDTSPKRALAVS